MAISSISARRHAIALVLLGATLLLGALSSSGCRSPAEPQRSSVDSDGGVSASSSGSAGRLPVFTLEQVISKAHAGLIVTVMDIEYYPDAPRSAPFPWSAIHGHDIVSARVEKVFFGDYQVGDVVRILQPREVELECPPGMGCGTSGGVRPGLTYEKGEAPVAMFLQPHEPVGKKGEYRYGAEKAYVRGEFLAYGAPEQRQYSMDEVLGLVERRRQSSQDIPR